MFLDSVRAKGNYYIYLREYDPTAIYSTAKIKRVTLYKFGRVDKALMNMYSWRKDFTNFPTELKKIGCARRDLEKWIISLEARAIKLKLLAT